MGKAGTLKKRRSLKWIDQNLTRHLLRSVMHYPMKELGKILQLLWLVAEIQMTESLMMNHHLVLILLGDHLLVETENLGSKQVLEVNLSFLVELVLVEALVLVQPLVLVEDQNLEEHQRGSVHLETIPPVSLQDLEDSTFKIDCKSAVGVHCLWTQV